jgi:energy-coupling factor transporter ATP-binding protein EcfA2
MATINEEFGRFLQWLRIRDAPPDARRIAKLVSANLDALIPATTAGGRRATVLTPILRASLEATTPEIDEVAVGNAVAPTHWTRLHSLTVGPFRGFQYTETLGLQKRLTLIYGPNGSGKSSACEALEFALLGSVEEASAKRVENLDEYFRNIYAGSYAAPELRVAGEIDGVVVTPNADLYRFCFIERNRIDNFARIAARSPAQADGLIAALFGLDAFNAFVGNFTSTLDNNLRTDQPLRRQLEALRATVATAETAVNAEIATLEAFQREEKALASDYQGELNYDGLLGLLGARRESGRLQELDQLLTKPVPPISAVNRVRIKILRRRIKAKQREFTRQRDALASQAVQVTYRDLYTAVMSLAPQAPDDCPACMTPLSQVSQNPYERAAQGLKDLRELAALQESLEKSTLELKSLLQAMREDVATVLKVDKRAKPSMEFLDRELAQAGRSVEATPQFDLESSPRLVWRALLIAARDAEAEDSKVREQLANRAALLVEWNLLRKFASLVEALAAKKSVFESQLQDARKKVETFSIENQKLIDQVSQESAEYERECRIRAGYAAFRQALYTYLEGLPQSLLADLNETTCDLYNRFNQGDPDVDKLTRLELPLRGGDKILLEFQGQPNTTYDALTLLSEGHIRCMGLAILIAKNIKLELPLIVFDDAVNAIDHDHRGGIRDTLLGDPRLANTQMIITCHSNEFIKDLNNHAGQNQTALYIFRHHNGSHHPSVIGGTTRHYLQRAATHLDELDFRTSLAYSRQALEHLCYRAWRKLSNRSEGELNLTIPGIDRSPELRGLTEQLAKRFSDLGASDTEYAAKCRIIKAGLDVLLGVPAQNLVWTYLNKGTHDEPDRDDFEGDVVRRVVGALNQIEAALS